MAPSHDAYLAHGDLIEAAIRAACRRHRLRPADAEDYASTARLHLLRNDCQALRAFGGRSSFHTYLVTVLARCFLDWQNARWGKWRPSAEARRLGPVAIQLDALISRDGFSPDEAIETMWVRQSGPESRARLEALAARLPRRSRRFFVSDDALETQPSSYGAADAAVLHEEAAGAAAHAALILDGVVGALPPQDRLILKMRFHDDFGVADIARALSLEAKPLYRRLERLLAAVRAGLERAGVTAESIADVLERRGFDRVEDVLREFREMPGNVRPFYGNGPDVQNSRTP